MPRWPKRDAPGRSPQTLLPRLRESKKVPTIARRSDKETTWIFTNSICREIYGPKMAFCPLVLDTLKAEMQELSHDMSRHTRRVWGRAAGSGGWWQPLADPKQTPGVWFRVSALAWRNMSWWVKSWKLEGLRIEGPWRARLTKKYETIHVCGLPSQMHDIVIKNMFRDLLPWNILTYPGHQMCRWTYWSHHPPPCCLARFPSEHFLRQDSGPRQKGCIQL